MALTTLILFLASGILACNANTPTITKSQLAELKNNMQQNVLRGARQHSLCVRLAFHDCVGQHKCDGCIDNDIFANKGLDRITERLDNTYNRLTDEEHTLLTKADWYALCGVVAVEGLLNKTVPFKVGRPVTENCTGINANSFPDAKDLTDVVGYFHDQFGFNADETVYIMGAHSLELRSFNDDSYWQYEPPPRDQKCEKLGTFLHKVTELEEIIDELKDRTSIFPLSSLKEYDNETHVQMAGHTDNMFSLVMSFKHCLKSLSLTDYNQSVDCEIRLMHFDRLKTKLASVLHDIAAIKTNHTFELGQNLKHRQSDLEKQICDDANSKTEPETSDEVLMNMVHIKNKLSSLHKLLSDVHITVCNYAVLPTDASVCSQDDKIGPASAFIKQLLNRPQKMIRQAVSANRRKIN